ncbi:hypothetical protein ACIPSK_24690, partial [Rhizobium sp. LARHSG275]
DDEEPGEKPHSPSPLGEKVPDRADKGATLRSTGDLSLALKLLAAPPLGPLICPSGIFSPMGRRGRKP